MKANNDSQTSRVLILVALIGAIGAIVAAIIGGWFTIEAARTKQKSESTATAIAQITLPALPTYTKVATYTPLPTYTDAPTDAPLPTYTPRPSYTPRPTYTPAPALSPTPHLPIASGSPKNWLPDRSVIPDYLSVNYDASYSSEDAAKTYPHPLEVYNNYGKWGWDTAYRQTYLGYCYELIRGVAMTPIVFRSITDAQDAWEWYKEIDSQSTSRKTVTSVNESNEVGDMRYLVWSNFPTECSDEKTRGLRIGFRRSNVLVTVDVHGGSGIDDSGIHELALKLARLIDFEIVQSSK